MAKVITVINQKGGVGKTTTAHAVGAWLQLKRHQKVLFLDLDQQGNLTYSLDASHSDYDALEVLKTGKLDVSRIQNTAAGFHILPSSPALANIDSALNQVGKEYRLKEALV
ncbi:MAG: ParA family protein [Leptotrichiaceae bacterium]